ncbi:MAG: hypothetical protein MHPSP_004257, partial [Paramarteilia canceri]
MTASGSVADHPDLIAPVGYGNFKVPDCVFNRYEELIKQLVDPNSPIFFENLF